jgi:hypothetical protein
MNKRFTRLLLGAIAALALAAPAAARTPPVTQETLLDRVQIEDMMVEYYTVLTQHVRHDIGEYFTDDAVLDANGFRLEGRAAIQHFYDSGTDTRIQPSNTYNMLYSNPRIAVTGDKAVMDVIWTGYLSDNKYTAPRLVEQGTEHTTFVKQQGVWMITSRTLVNTGGMPTVLGENAGN